MQKNLVLTAIPLNELIQAITTETKEYIDRAFNELLSGQEQSTTTVGTQLLTRKQTAQTLGISLPTLHQWTKDGKIQSYRIGKTIRYKQEDVFNALNLQQYSQSLITKPKL